MYSQIRNEDLQTLFERLKNEEIRKRDLVVPSKYLRMHDGLVVIDELPAFLSDAGKSWNDLLNDFGISSQVEEGKETISCTPFLKAENQIASKLNIARSYYKFLRDEHVDMLDYNVSELFKRDDRNFFIRTFINEDGGEGMLRALLSDRFKVIDHLDVVTTMLKAIKDLGVEVNVGRCNLTENNMYVEVLKQDVYDNAKELLRDYRAPDGKDRNNKGVMAGFVLRNSETGGGKYEIVPRMIVGVCDNGLTFKKDALASTHLGSQMDSGIKWSARTRDKEVELIESQTHDAVTTFLSTDYMQERLDELTGQVEKLDFPVQATENVCKQLRLSDDETNDVLSYFVEGGDTTNFGIVQALTFHAHEVENADHQFDLEEKALDIFPSIKTVHDRKN